MDKKTVKDENGKTIFDRVPYKNGRGSKLVRRTEEVEVAAILAIKLKMLGSSMRYSITNPTAQYSVSDKFFESLKRSKDADELPRKCIQYLFESGPEKWMKRYQGYNNLLK